MRVIHGLTIALAALLPALGQDSSRAVAGGGISVPGWVGAVDAGAQKAGQTIKDTKMTGQGDSLQITTGPAASFGIPPTPPVATTLYLPHSLRRNT